MKTKLLSQKRVLSFYFSAALMLCVNAGWSQQVIGQFPTMNGGMEGQFTETTNLPVISSSGTTSFTDWSIGSSSNAGTKEMVVGATARSGNSFTAQSLASGKDNSRTQSPTNPSTNYLLPSTDYVIQFFYRCAVDPLDYVAGAIYLNGTSDGQTFPKTSSENFVANKWIKYAASSTTKANATKDFDKGPGNYACIRLGGVADGMMANVDVDDFVVYSGTEVDANAPAAATAPMITSGGVVSWTASADVDGGGYVVVSYASMPNDDNDLNQNGIYIVGSTTTNGTGGLLGTVVYIGTDVSFTDAAYAEGNYYKIYTVDKAFNYSDEITASSSLGIAKNEISGLKVYPNPVTNGKVFINSTNSETMTTTVYDILGKQLIQKEVSNGTLDVSNLSKGVYLMKVSQGTATSTRKLIVN